MVLAAVLKTVSIGKGDIIYEQVLELLLHWWICKPVGKGSHYLGRFHPWTQTFNHQEGSATAFEVDSFFTENGWL